MGNLDTQAILDRLDAIDARLSNLESSTVLSAPKLNVKEVEVYVDQNGNEYAEPGLAGPRRSPISVNAFPAPGHRRRNTRGLLAQAKPRTALKSVSAA